MDMLVILESTWASAFVLQACTHVLLFHGHEGEEVVGGDEVDSVRGAPATGGCWDFPAN